MNDFITNTATTSTPYPLSHTLCYNNLSTHNQSYVKAFYCIIETQTYREACKDTNWIHAIQEEIKALEDNHTWRLVKLPPGKVPIGCIK